MKASKNRKKQKKRIGNSSQLTELFYLNPVITSATFNAIRRKHATLFQAQHQTSRIHIEKLAFTISQSDRHHRRAIDLRDTIVAAYCHHRQAL
jgi:hypothetical protein